MRESEPEATPRPSQRPSQRPPIGAPPAPTPPVDDEDEDDVDCPFCGGTGKRRRLDDVDSIEAWASVLEDKGVDLEARQDWTTLFASSEQGKLDALAIVHTILKKAIGGHPVRNASAFVVICVKNCWEKIKDVPDDVRAQAKRRRRW